MTSRPSLRTRILLAVAVPLALVTLIGLGVTAHAAYTLLFWGRATAVHVSTEFPSLARGDTPVWNYVEEHYAFTKPDGSEVRLIFLDNPRPDNPPLSILYDPSVSGRLLWDEPGGDRWARSWLVELELGLGLIAAILAGLPCLVCAGLLVLGGRKPPPPPPPSRMARRPADGR